MFHHFYDSSLLHGLLSSPYGLISSSFVLHIFLTSLLLTLITSPCSWCILVPHHLFPSAAKYFTLPVFLNSNSREKNLVGPGLVLWQSVVVSTGLETLVQKTNCSPINGGGWVGFHMTPPTLPKGFSSPGATDMPVSLGREPWLHCWRYIVLKVLYWFCSTVMVNGMKLLNTCYIPVFFVETNLLFLFISQTDGGGVDVMLIKSIPHAKNSVGWSACIISFDDKNRMR